jgi:ribA/ribD-fused uncharacterized protein
MNVCDNHSVAPPEEVYDPELNLFGHAEYMEANPHRVFGFTEVFDFFDGVAGPAQFLSNFYPSSLRLPANVYARLLAPEVIEGRERPSLPDLSEREFGTGEHAFQAFKARSYAAFDAIASAEDANLAKALGRRTALRPDWNDVKVEVMREVVAAKFAPDTEAARKLLATGTAMLIEGTTWYDAEWGVCLSEDGYIRGRNLLGSLLMERRGALRAALLP